MIRKFLQKLAFPNSYNNEAFVKYLKKKGITIGEGCIFFSPNTTYIDIQRPHGMQVGNYVKIASGVSILCHDYARSVLCSLKEYGNVGEFKQTVIGNNVFIGMNSIILMGSKIGNNSIVGAGSIVSGTFPDDSIICGNPAKRICSLDEYYQKRKLKEVSEAKEFVILWRKLYHRNPTIDEMTNLSKDFREELKQRAVVTDTKIKVKQVSKDGTIKYLVICLVLELLPISSDFSRLGGHLKRLI